MSLTSKVKDSLDEKGDARAMIGGYVKKIFKSSGVECPKCSVPILIYIGETKEQFDIETNRYVMFTNGETIPCFNCDGRLKECIAAMRQFNLTADAARLYELHGESDQTGKNKKEKKVNHKILDHLKRAVRANDDFMVRLIAKYGFDRGMVLRALEDMDKGMKES